LSVASGIVTLNQRFKPKFSGEISMSKKYSLSALILWASISLVQAAGLHPSYVSIQMNTDAIDSEPRLMTMCGGVVVDEARRLVATAWHCVPNQRSVIEKPGVFSVGGMSAKLLKFQPEADMAIFHVENLKGVKAPKFRQPNKGEIVVASAYYDEFPVTAPVPTADRFIPMMSVRVTLDWEGKVAAVARAERVGMFPSPNKEATPYVWVVATGNTAPGFSGGPVFDKAGNFVGIISNVNGGFTNISSSSNVLEIIKDIP
jgi:S1-C subfamily serine protease